MPTTQPTAMDTKEDLAVRHDFPIFAAHPELIYLDSAATTHKPASVITAEADVYSTNYASVHRGLYTMAQAVTEAYERVRQQVATFINAASASEIVFTSNATAALNLAAHLEAARLQAGDEIILTTLEHHSNIVPWQNIAQEKGVSLRWIGIDDDYRLSLGELSRALSPATKLIVITQLSNVTGTVIPITEVVAAAHTVGARVLVDAAQSAGRLPINVQTLGVDYVVCSGHKLYGPTGTGWLYAKEALLAEGTPAIVGGGSVVSVSQQGAQWAESPHRYEAGTPNIAGVIALGYALTYLESIGRENIWQHEQALTAYTLKALQTVPGLQLFGPADTPNRAGIFSFQLHTAH
ncbi:MAG: cysteine desulfurase, partial [Candidatus Andersenbacteria bacterium]